MAPSMLILALASAVGSAVVASAQPVAFSVNEAIAGDAASDGSDADPTASGLRELRMKGPPTATPLGKVVELLDVLEKQLKEEGQADAASYGKFVTWYHNASFVATKLIQETSGNIETFKGGIDEKKAFITGEGRRLDKVAGELAGDEKDLQEATDRRKKENDVFKANEETLADSVDSLQRSLEVLGADASGSSSGGASLAAVAKHLRTALFQDKSLQLSAGQRATLDGFFRAGARAEKQQRARQEGGSLAPDFLQLRSESDGPYAAYNPKKSGVVTTLQGVLEKSSKELDAARSVEAKAKTAFNSFRTTLEEQIENKKKTMSEIRTQTSHAQQALSQFESKLSQAEKTLEVAKKELEEAEALNRKKTIAYKERVAKRSDEIMAVREATQLLTSDAAKKLLDGSTDVPAGNSSDGDAAPSFLQVAAALPMRRKALTLLRGAAKPKVALLALQVHHRAASSLSHRADPFGKVKSLVREMLDKLQSEQSAEAEKKAWCDKELAENTKVQTNKQEAIQKLTDRIGVMDAELAEFTGDINTATEELEQLETSTAMATKVREQEKTVAEAAIQQYKDAQELINTAMSVLQKFYKGKASGIGSGVTGLLEIAVSDYADLQKEAETAEAEAAAEYKELMQESEVRKAVFQKDLEYASRGKARLEAEKMRTSTDVTSYQKELQAVETYLEKVNKSCIAKAATYEERKSRREEELKSLKEALDFLKGE
eukprot:TRINITY_DN6263_c0_g1_i2.p1 TRINITY_DN6263_c0_g1~~TRINITY_DN6263_c0_g1_i2.p1  ORF type:complete len:719 (+),score=257.51 TRINITY_DN6263_c0_g1_i2:1182-3338(+)